MRLGPVGGGAPSPFALGPLRIVEDEAEHLLELRRCGNELTADQRHRFKELTERARNEIERMRSAESAESALREIERAVLSQKRPDPTPIPRIPWAALHQAGLPKPPTTRGGSSDLVFAARGLKPSRSASDDLARELDEWAVARGFERFALRKSNGRWRAKIGRWNGHGRTKIEAMRALAATIPTDVRRHPEASTPGDGEDDYGARTLDLLEALYGRSGPSLHTRGG